MEYADHTPDKPADYARRLWELIHQPGSVRWAREQIQDILIELETKLQGTGIEDAARDILTSMRSPQTAAPVPMYDTPLGEKVLRLCMQLEEEHMQAAPLLDINYLNEGLQG